MKTRRNLRLKALPTPSTSINPTSEVVEAHQDGCENENQQVLQSEEVSECGSEIENCLKMMIKQQESQMEKLITTLISWSNITPTKTTLPEFNPEKNELNAKA